MNNQQKSYATSTLSYKIRRTMVFSTTKIVIKRSTSMVDTLQRATDFLNGYNPKRKQCVFCCSSFIATKRKTTNYYYK